MTEQNNNLSARETEILKLVAKGLTNREIAQQLTISPNTVKVHLRNIFEKIGAASRTEATMYGIEHGIVDVPGGAEAPAPEPAGWRTSLRRYTWFGIPAVLLILALLVLLTINALRPPPTPEAQLAAEMAQRWQELAPMPAARAAMAAAAYDGQIYAIAGEGPEGVSGSVFRYTPETDNWSQLSDKPTPVADVHGVLIGEKIYVPGGRLGNGNPTDVLEIYDPRRDTWSEGARLPVAVSAYALADFEGQMYLFGGWDGTRALDVVYVYDPATDAWRAGTPMATARRDAGAVALADKIVVLGGRNEGGALMEAVGYFPSRDASGEDPWDGFVALPEARYGFGVQSTGETIYLFGGITNDGVSGMPFAYQFSNSEWLPIQIDDARDFTQPTLVSLRLKIYFLSPEISNIKTSLWQYQAFFEVFLPIIQ
jgi:DNA-binding CsgD family transcriptional regulator